MRLTRALAAALIMAAVVTGAAGTSADPAIAATSDFEITSFDAEYFLGRDADGTATLRTVERIVAVFPGADQNHGIERALPLQYGNVPLDLQVTAVTDAAGSTLNYSRNDDPDFAVLRIGDADRYVHGSQEYRIEYTQRNVIRHFTDTAADEFYWDVNGTGWAQAFGDVSATVHLQDGTADDLTGELSCYRGGYGSTDTCEIARSGDTITANAAGLLPRENMTIAIGFEPSAFADPPDPRNHWAFTVLPWVLMGLSLLAVLALAYSRTFIWRDDKGRGIIVPQYTPPRNAHPLLAAELLRRKNAGLPAQIVGFAVNRILQLREFADVPTNERYQVELLAGWPTVSPEEKPALKALFGKLTIGETQLLKGDDYALGARIAKLRKKTAADVVSNGLRAAPRSGWQKAVRWASFLVFLASVVLWFSSFEVTDSALLKVTAFACMVGAYVAYRLAKPPLLLTRAGAEVRDYLYGIRDYVILAEADRIRVLQAPGTAERIDVTDESAVIKLYEKLLPYAMIFGVEREWIAELNRHYEVAQAPEWYQGTGQLDDITRFNVAISSTLFASAAASSSGSSGSSWGSSGGSSFSGGSSGGGFSGGGGGGGGGGGW